MKRFLRFMFNRSEPPQPTVLTGDERPSARSSSGRPMWPLIAIAVLAVGFFSWVGYLIHASSKTEVSPTLQKAAEVIEDAGRWLREDEGILSTLRIPKPAASVVGEAGQKGDTKVGRDDEKKGGRVAPLVPAHERVEGATAGGPQIPPRHSPSVPILDEGDPRVRSAPLPQGTKALASSHSIVPALTSSQGTMPQGMMQPSPPRGREPTEMERLLTPTHTPPAVARTIENANRYVFAGELLGQCVFRVMFVSGVPSGVACTLGSPVYGKTGRDLLMPVGTIISGEIVAVVGDGQERVWGLAARAVTPACKSPYGDEVQEIDLNSPFTGPLGEGGLGGHVNTHFWKKVGAALLVALTRTAVNLTANVGSGGSSTGPTVILPNMGSSVGGVMQQEASRGISIPPTITKFPGEMVSVFAARNLYFPERRCISANN